MKKLKHSFLALSGIATFLLATGCKSEFDVTTDYQVTPIIFGLLDQSEEYHYIRINKTFLGQGNAYDFAKVADSSYFDQVDAKVIEVGTGREWQLRDTILENKNENGAFYAPQHKLYYFWTKNTHQNPNTPSYTNPDDPLNPDAVYRLEANINNGEHIVKGQTKLVSGVSLNVGGSQNLLQLKKNNNPGEYTATSVSWPKAAGAGGQNSRYNVKFIFHWDEYTGGIPTSKSFTWNLSEISGENNVGSTISISIPGEQFYQMVRDRIPIDPSVERRLHTRVEVILTAGSEELTNYILAAQPSSSLAQSKPTYTNLEGAIGLFSARFKDNINKEYYDGTTNYRTLNQVSMRELCEGPYTYELDFCSNHPADYNPLNLMSFRCQ